MKYIAPLILTLVLTLFAPLLIAGGSHHPVQVIALHIKEDKTTFSLELKILGNSETWIHSECRKVMVSGYFDTRQWEEYKKPVNFDTHIKALVFLKEAESKKDIISLGYIGNGLIKKRNCHYLSKGLFIENNIVFSVNEKI